MNDPRPTNSEILTRVARREITPEHAAALMLDEGEPSPWLRLATALAIATFLILWLLMAVPVQSQAPHFTSSDGLAAARACVSEATWVGASTPDCGGLIQVVESRRGQHETFSAALAHTMPHFTAGRTDRVWALHLAFGPIRENPEGWPYAYGAQHHSAQWLAVYHRVRQYMLGEIPLPCSPQPISWLGRQTDGHVLADRLSTGRWREADCGGETHNAFIYLADVD